VVQGRVIFPATGYLEVARAATASTSALRSVFFLQPLAAEAAGLTVECAVSDGRFEVRSSEDATLPDVHTHCSGVLAARGGWRRIDHASVRRRSCARAACVRTTYDFFDAVGLQYGPDYRTLERAWGGASDACARLRGRVTRQGTMVHPADLDDALCASVIVASRGGGDGTRLPFAMDDAMLQGSADSLWAVRRVARRVRPRPAS